MTFLHGRPEDHWPPRRTPFDDLLGDADERDICRAVRSELERAAETHLLGQAITRQTKHAFVAQLLSKSRDIAWQTGRRLDEVKIAFRALLHIATVDSLRGRQTMIEFLEEP